MLDVLGCVKLSNCSYRLEHAFDNCDLNGRHVSGKKSVKERIVSAVDFHRRAIRFCDAFTDAFQWQNCLALTLGVINITISLYYATMSKGDFFKMVFGMTLGFGVMFHWFMLNIPAQLVKDNSLEVTDKAYSSLWYNAHVKEQTLLLPIIHRGLRPCQVTLGKICPISFENYATEMKAAFSYFTMLLSLT